MGELKNPGVVYGTVRAVTKRRVATLQEVNFWDIFQRVKWKRDQSWVCLPRAVLGEGFPCLWNWDGQGEGSAYLGSTTSLMQGACSLQHWVQSLCVWENARKVFSAVWREREKYLGINHVEHTHFYPGCVCRAVQELSGHFSARQTSRISPRTVSWTSTWVPFNTCVLLRAPLRLLWWDTEHPQWHRSSLELGEGAVEWPEWSLLARAACWLKLNSPKCQWCVGCGGDPGIAACVEGCREIPAASRPIMDLPKHREKASWSSQVVLEFDPEPWLIWSPVQSSLGWVADSRLNPLNLRWDV